MTNWVFAETTHVVMVAVFEIVPSFKFSPKLVKQLQRCDHARDRKFCSLPLLCPLYWLIQQALIYEILLTVLTYLLTYIVIGRLITVLYMTLMYRLFVAQCGGILPATTTEQTIRSPGYYSPGFYNSQIKCIWRIQVCSTYLSTRNDRSFQHISTVDYTF